MGGRCHRKLLGNKDLLKVVHTIILFEGQGCTKFSMFRIKKNLNYFYFEMCKKYSKQRKVYAVGYIFFPSVLFLDFFFLLICFNAQPDEPAWFIGFRQREE